MIFRRFPLSGAWDTSHYPKDVPFEVPAGWVWTTLDSIARFSGGKTPSMDDKANWDNGKHLWITSKDMKSEAICNSQIMLSDSGLQGMTIHQPGTILMVNRSGILRRALPLGILQKEATINQDLKAITPFMFELTPFLFFCLKAFEPIILQKYKKAGTTVDNINFDHFVTIPIPLPPIQEQGRIVQSIQTWTSRIEDIEKSSDQIQNAIEATKNIILELAIHGKIVAQDPSEEPAIESLKRINSAFQPSHNLHYEGELPNGWCFSTIGDLFQHNTGKALNGKNQAGEELRYITTSNLYWDRFDLKEVRTMPFTEAEKEKCRATKGDLLVCEGGDIGRTAIWPYDFDVMIQNHIHRLRPREDISVRFFYYVFLLYKQMGLIGGKGIAILGLSSRELDKMVIPVPPVPEQHRIVTVIENIFAQMDDLASNLS